MLPPNPRFLRYEKSKNRRKKLEGHRLGRVTKILKKRLILNEGEHFCRIYR